MLIDKVEQFYTDEEREQMKELRGRWDDVDTRWGQVIQKKEPEAKAMRLLREFIPIGEKRKKLRAAAEWRYIQHFENKADIMRDIREVIDAVESADYESTLKAALDKNGLIHSTIMLWLWSGIRPQLAALEYWHFKKDDALDILKAAAEAIAGPTPEGETFDFLLKEPLIEQAAPVIEAAKADRVSYPVDKVNSNVWNLFKQDTNGQLAFDFGAISKFIDTANEADRKAGVKIPTSYSIDFEGIDGAISKRLTPFDKRAYVSIGALYDAGFPVVTLTQIHYAMGYENSPSMAQIEKLRTSLTKMMGAIITLNNAAEIKRGYKYPPAEYTGNLLYAERLKVSDHQRTAEAIHILRRPILIDYASGRNHCETIDGRLLSGPYNKTDENLAIEDYILIRILRATRSEKGSEKIRFSTICEKVGITNAKQKQRLPGKLAKFMEHYKSCGQIKRYRIDNDSVTVFMK